jgi:hypothetical protein
MLNGGSRWYVLSALAVANLVLWVAIAGIVGLIVSDRVDLGFETLMRQGQATAVSVFESVSEVVSAPTARPTSTSTPPPATPVGGAVRPEATSLPYRTPRPVATTAINAQPTSTPVTQPSQTARSTPTRQSTPTTQPLVSAPLLLSDPAISSLTKLDAEMDRSAEGRPVQIRYTEETLNREITTLYQNNPELPFRDVHVDMKHDEVVITGKTTVLGFRVDASATGTVSVVDCLPELEIERISVAGVMTPGFVRDEVEGLLLETMSWYPADYPLCLEQIVIEETKATIYGHRR